MTGIGPKQIARKMFRVNWLPPRDSNPDMLLQRQLSYHSFMFRRYSALACLVLSFQ
jgi:hypothetical protein